MSPLFWKIALLKARIKNVSQENRCSPWNVLERMLGTPSQPGAIPLFSFLISLGDVYEDESSLNGAAFPD
jgi:hypothetical protein